MKTPLDPRHKQRIKLIQTIFAYKYHPQNQKLIQSILDHLTNIDQYITKSAPEWPLSTLNQVDLAILRVGVYELLYTDTPPKVVIDEAVEIAKTYGAENSSSFINGVLGNILATINKK